MAVSSSFSWPFRYAMTFLSPCMGILGCRLAASYQLEPQKGALRAVICRVLLTRTIRISIAAMIICVCQNVSERDIAQAVAKGCHSFSALQEELQVGKCCGTCLCSAQ